MSAKISRREFVGLAGATVASVMLAACKQAAAPAATTAPAATAAPAVVQASVARNDFEKAFEEVGRQWAGTTLVTPWGERNGHYSVCEKAALRFTELTGIKTVWEHGESITGEKFWLDLASKSMAYDFLGFTFQDFGRYEAAKGLLPLDEYVKNPKFPPVDLTRHIPNLLETYGKYKGVLYGIPTLADAMINMYNVEHFQEAGLDPEKPPMTWEDLHEMGKTLTRDDRYGFALMGGRKTQIVCEYSVIFFGLKKKGWYNDDGTSAFDCSEGVQAMTILADWLTEIAPPASAAWDIVEATESVAQGVCSMMIQWPGMMPTLVDPEKSKVIGKLGFAQPPLGTALGGHAFGVLSTSKNPDPSYLLVEYLTAPEVQREWVKEGYAITVADLFDDPEVQSISPWIKATGDALKVGIGWPTDQDTSGVWSIISQYANMAVTKELPPAEANATMVQEINKFRKEGGYIK